MLASKLAVVAVSVVAMCAFTARAQPVIPPLPNFFVPAAGDQPGTNTRLGFAYDTAGGVLYISQPTGGIVRYSVPTRQNLPTWNIGTHLTSVAVTPDGSRVIAGEADTLPGPGTSRIGRVYSLNAASGASTEIQWTTNYGFGTGVGANSVGITSDGYAWIAPYWASVSGEEFLRRIDLATNTLTTVAGVRPGAMGIVNVNSTQSGMLALGNSFQLWTYSTVTHSFSGAHSPFGLGDYSPDLTSVASTSFPGGGPGVGRLLDANFAQIAVLPGTTLTYTFDPVRPFIYYADRISNEFVILNSSTGAFVGRFATGDIFDSTIDLSVSSDGRWAFVAVPGGVRVIELPAPPHAALFGLAMLTLARRRRRSVPSLTL